MSRHVDVRQPPAREHDAVPVPTGARERRGARRRASFSRGDLTALVAGAALVLCVLAWFAWRIGQNLAEDRAVEAGRTPAPAHGH